MNTLEAVVVSLSKSAIEVFIISKMHCEADVSDSASVHGEHMIDYTPLCHVCMLIFNLTSHKTLYMGYLLHVFSCERERSLRGSS